MVVSSITPLLLSLAGGPPDPPSPGGQAMVDSLNRISNLSQVSITYLRLFHALLLPGP